MTTKNRLSITKDVTNKKVFIVREFNAPVEEVWKAWTESELLDQWWAPKPYKACTKKMDFREGGSWLYYMEGPDGSKTWVKVDFETISPNKSFTAVDYFCDENGVRTDEFPGMHWINRFNAVNGGTKVSVEITGATVADLEKIIEMGFEEGFTAALGNLDELLERS